MLYDIIVCFIITVIATQYDYTRKVHYYVSLISLLQPCKVRAFGIKDKPTTAFEIKFSDSVLSRDKTLDTLK